MAKVITGMVRFSYVHVFEPTSVNGGEAKYNVSIIIPKSDKATIAAINNAIAEVKVSDLAKWGGKIPAANFKTPLRDGDVEREDEAYANSYFLNASSKNKPQIIGKDRQYITDPNVFYSGCYGKASLNLYGFSASGNKGIAAGLNGLIKLEEGEPLAGGSDAMSDFADDLNDDFLN